jgi:hypothetical protein
MARRLVDLGVVAPGAVATFRAERGTDPGLPWDGFDLIDERSYGTTTLHLMRRHDEAASHETRATSGRHDIV